MVVALTTWNGRISPVLDVAREVLIIEMNDGIEAARRIEALPGTDLPEQVKKLTELGIRILICGAISKPLAQLLSSAEIDVIPFTAGDADQVLAAWMTGHLPDAKLMMPGCCKNKRQQQCVNRGVRRNNRKRIKNKTA